MAISTSQAEANALSKLNLGTSSDVLNKTPDSPLGTLLKDLVQGVVDELGKSIDGYGISASNNLKQSIKPSGVTIEDDTVSVGISAPFYWKFVNYGVNGTEVQHGAPSWGKVDSPDLSFKDSVSQWITNRGITLPEGFSSYESLTFAMMTNIKKEGKKPRPFFTDVVNERLVDVLKKPIEKLIGRAIRIKIVEPWR